MLSFFKLKSVNKYVAVMYNIYNIKTLASYTKPY